MWLIIPVAFLVVLAIIGGILVSGIYAAVLLPIAALILLWAVLSMWRRSRDPEFRKKFEERQRQPLGGSGGVAENQSTTTSTPDDIVDARRSAQ